MVDRPPENRPRKPTDLLAVEDIAELYGWDTKRAWTLLRSLGRRGLCIRFEGHRRLYVRRGDLESAMTQVHELDVANVAPPELFLPDAEWRALRDAVDRAFPHLPGGESRPPT
jgi:hypothetical protein